MLLCKILKGHDPNHRLQVQSHLCALVGEHRTSVLEGHSLLSGGYIWALHVAWLLVPFLSKGTNVIFPGVFHPWTLSLVKWSWRSSNVLQRSWWENTVVWLKITWPYIKKKKQKKKRTLSVSTGQLWGLLTPNLWPPWAQGRMWSLRYSMAPQLSLHPSWLSIAGPGPLQ